MLFEHQSNNKGTLLIIILLALLAGIILLAWKNREIPLSEESPAPSINNEVKHPSFFPNEPLEKAIENYLLTQKEFSWKNEEDSVNVCVIENLEPTNQLFPFSIWVYCAEYKLENEELTTVSGTSIPVKINYPNELSFYDTKRFSHEAPRDGTLNAGDIQKIFSPEAQQNLSSLDKQILITRAETTALLKLQEKTNP